MNFAGSKENYFVICKRHLYFDFLHRSIDSRKIRQSLIPSITHSFYYCSVACCLFIISFKLFYYITFVQFYCHFSIIHMQNEFYISL